MTAHFLQAHSLPVTWRLRVSGLYDVSTISNIKLTADVGMVGIIPHGFEAAYINQKVALGRQAFLDSHNKDYFPVVFDIIDLRERFKWRGGKQICLL